MAGLNSIQKKDISALENEINTLTENMKVIAGSVDDINDQVLGFSEQFDKVKSNIDSLEKQVKDFMSEVKSNNYVERAKNENEKYNNELNLRYAEHDLIRKKINEIVNELERGYINKNKLLSQSEQSKLFNSDYYLAHALVAICAWAKNEKKLARKELNKALELNEERTSLLFSMVYIKLNRKSVAIKWMKKYFDSQNAKDMNSDVFGVIDMLSSYNYNEFKDVSHKYFDEWVHESRSDSNRNFWKDYFNSHVQKIDENEYPFSRKYLKDYPRIIRKLELCYSYNNVYADFLGSLNKIDVKTSVDKMFNDLLYDYKDRELELRRGILKNKMIIECNGNLEEANLKYEKYDNFVNVEKNFYDELSNVIINRSDVSLKNKKLAVALCKSDIINGYKEVFGDDDITDDEFEIKINEWHGKTKDGSNEKELQESIAEYIKKPFSNEADTQKYYSPKTIYCGIFIVIGIILAFIKFYVGLSVVLVGSFMLMFFLISVSKNRVNIVKSYNETVEKYMFELNNVLAEIVDMKFICKKNAKNRDEFINFVSSFDKKDYM